ncbi:4'-phosphopantetheinyl transferase superfamily protein [Streptomyces sp. ID05-04B]|uniref:4'-phosphopantetheinyl transferase family protein n=1 Tax=unclassified Streptomyces TaxID=2593676 RepID=UPI000D19AB27|nr:MULTISPECIES: 4'-phosphopantetheinyl transferase superfamily protein [unclassified Streptomyces]AVV45618.1 4'-phosphopantetheinyl transferase [Streptomyces sp. P3]MDX5562903.1 4'-phosphopantetheinyl transferase superfamily protein [Streptomyces sp. ID05-04B]
MIGELLPAPVVAVEAFGEEGVREFGNTPLYPQEEALLVRAVDKRRREFTIVRGCARRAMEKLGVPAQPVLPGLRGAPHWPDGVTGSMTHCADYSAAALVRAADLASLGIDAEPHGPLPEGVLSAVALPAEAARLERLAADRPEVHWDRLLFSAKESVYKAWFPLTRKWLDFEEADIDLSADADPAAVDTGPAAGAQGGFRARLLVPGPVVGGRRVEHFDGRWTVRHGLVATAVTVPHA